ncbi:MAG: 50S ribosomal protein L24 [Candidatus Latescibacterota bacterium]|nr:50S ribosomal protein L24 [Candidatus Latescibacterota bacterium]
MVVRRGDTVLIISGNEKGKRGRVLQVIPEKNRLIVEGVRMMKKHTKPTQRDPQGGIVEREAPIHASNAMVVDPKTDEPTRIGKKRLDDGRQMRVAMRSGEMIDSQ